MRPSGPVPPAHAPHFRIFKHLDIGRARSARRAGIFLYVSSPCRVAPTGGRFPPIVVFFPGVFPVRRLEPDKGTHQPLFPVALPQYALWYVQTRCHCKHNVVFLCCRYGTTLVVSVAVASLWSLLPVSIWLFLWRLLPLVYNMDARCRS